MDSKKLSRIFMFVFAFACVGFTFFMPWAELGLPTEIDQFPEPLKGIVGASGLLPLFNQVKAVVAGSILKVLNDPNFEYYVYAFFLGMALVAVAIAISLIGREDAEEKTVLPTK